MLSSDNAFVFEGVDYFLSYILIFRVFLGFADMIRSFFLAMISFQSVHNCMVNITFDTFINVLKIKFNTAQIRSFVYFWIKAM